MATDNKDKVLNVPNLRFPEFCEEWMRCTLGDITENFSRRNKEEILYPMFSVTNNKGFIPQSEQFEDREMIGEDIKAYKIIHKDDFAYNPARINVGSIAKYNEENPCMISSLYVCFKTNPKIDNDWMMQLLKTPKMNFYYNINGEGGVRIYLFYPNFARIKTSYPTLKEQQKISSFLTLLDERISTQNKIIKQLQSLIKGIYDKTFANFSKYQTLSAICKIQKGQQINGEELSEFGEYYVMNGGIEPSGYYDKYNTMPNTISISEGGNSCGYIQFNSVPFWSGGHCYTIQCISPEYNILFVYHYLKSKEREIMALRIGSGLPNIQKKDLEKFPIPVLSLETQISIVNGINKIETKLKYEKDILSAYQTQKAYLLRNLFI